MELVKPTRVRIALGAILTTFGDSLMQRYLYMTYAYSLAAMALL
jgi:hypothetical protein